MSPYPVKRELDTRLRLIVLLNRVLHQLFHLQRIILGPVQIGVQPLILILLRTI